MADLHSAYVRAQSLASMFEGFAELVAAVGDAAKLQQEIAEKTRIVEKLRADVEAAQAAKDAAEAEAKTHKGKAAKSVQDASQAAETLQARALSNAQAVTDKAKAEAAEIIGAAQNEAHRLKTEADADIAAKQAAAQADLDAIAERVKAARDHLDKLGAV